VTAAFREIHDGIRAELIREVGRHRFRLWFRDTAVAHVADDAVTLAVPTEVHRTWLEFTYGEVLRRACAHVLGDGVNVHLQVSERQGAARAVRERLPVHPDEWDALLARRRPAPSLASWEARDQDRFVPLLLSQLVHGNDDVNPPSVYLYGEAATGKTHLLLGLQAEVQERAPGTALYLTTRRFTSMYVSALRTSDVEAVRAFELDIARRRLVLIDDVDALAGRTATESELVRLRERVIGTGTRFVFAARRHPRDLGQLSPTLRSWLMGGVMVRLPTPDRAGVRAILDARAVRFGVVPSDAVREAILDRTASLSGAVDVLDRWAAASLELGSSLGVEWLDELAPSVTATAGEEVVRRAKDVVAQHFGVARALLDEPTKVRSAAHPRRVAMYLVYRAAALPLSQLGAAFGLKSHSSVSRAIQEMRALRERDADLEQVLDGLLARL
jgi:chromosomal replication initiator protein